MSVQVRNLGAADIAPMRAMLAMFGEAFEDVPTCTDPPPDFDIAPAPRDA